MRHINNTKDRKENTSFIVRYANRGGGLGIIFSGYCLRIIVPTLIILDNSNEFELGGERTPSLSIWPTLQETDIKVDFYFYLCIFKNASNTLVCLNQAAIQ